MADAVEVAVEQALLAHLAGLTLVPAVPIAMPAKAFTPPAPKTGTVIGRYLQATFLPAPTETLHVDEGSEDRHYGILQVSAFYGQDTTGSGAASPARLAAQIIEHFPRGKLIRGDGVVVEIYERPTRGPLLIESGWAQIPVSISYRCFA